MIATESKNMVTSEGKRDASWSVNAMILYGETGPKVCWHMLPDGQETGKWEKVQTTYNEE